MGEPTRVLIVDDDAVLLQALPEALGLRLDGVQIDVCVSAAEALQRITRVDYDTIVTDIKMPGMDGLALLEQIRSLRPDTPTLLITGHGQHDLAVQALRGGAYDFIQKPIDRDYFIASLTRAIQTRQLRREVDAHRSALERHALELEHMVEERTRSLHFLAEASRVLAYSLEADAVLHTIARLSVPELADWCVVDAVTEDGALKRLAGAHADPAKADLIERFRSRYAPDPHRRLGAGQVITSGQPQMFGEISDEQLREMARDAEHLVILRELGARSAMIVPLLARGQVFGAVSFVRARAGQPYGSEDLALAENLCRRAALAVLTARLYEREHRIAETLQRAFLPVELPQLPFLALHAAYLPGAKESEVGGDWYDAFALPDGRLALSVGDVTGKGLHAAVAMSQIRQAIRAAMLDAATPAGTLARVSRLLQLGEPAEMATAVVAVVDPMQETLIYATAGHPAPVLGGPDGSVAFLPAGGLPLGTARFDPVDRTVVLDSQTLVVLYSDGLIESSRDVTVGEAALLDAVAAELRDPSPDPAQRIHRQILADRRAPDDVAILTLRMAPAAPDHLVLTVPAIPSAVALIRHELRLLMQRYGVPARADFGLQVAVGEAVTNAIEHAYGPSSGSITVRARAEGAHFLVEVRDRGRWRAPQAAGRGRGLQLIRALTDAELVAGENGTTVRMMVALTETAAPTPIQTGRPQDGVAVR